jgi:hypothetical protein
MRYRLRTLLIILGIGPPTLASVWLIRADSNLEPIAALTFWVLFVGMITVLIDASLFRKWGP